MRTTIIPFITAMCLLASCGNAQKPAEKATGKVVTVNNDNQQTDSVSLDEAIGEMLLVGFRGTSIDAKSHIRRDIQDYHVGSVILFDYDAPTGSRGRNFPTILSAQKCAELGFDTVQHYARLTAEMLHGLGINLNFAPVADVNINPSCPVIGKMGRSFSADPNTVSQCCAIWIEEQHAQGVASCLKHFPGHGSAKGDTHKGLVDVSKTWESSELTPYRKLSQLNTLDMVMTAHVINRQLDPSGLPASLSPRITSYLRDTLGFQGVIVTDDLAMGAIAGQYNLEQTIRMALDAGADLLCLSNNGGHGYDPDLVPKVVRIIYKLIDEGAVTPERIRESAIRVREMKNKIAK